MKFMMNKSIHIYIHLYLHTHLQGLCCTGGWAISILLIYVHFSAAFVNVVHSMKADV